MKRTKLLAIAGVGLLVGIYITANVAAPALYRAKPISTTPVAEDRNAIIVPRLGINTTIRGNGVDDLTSGAWHRLPDQGNPAIGGNMVISAHSFVFGVTPLDTHRQSYFFNLFRVSVGDEVYVDWRGQRYKYLVTKTHQVAPDATQIEAPSREPKLTIYTCTAAGSSDGRVVVEARPVTTYTGR